MCDDDFIEVGMIYVDDDNDYSYTRCPICGEVDILEDCVKVDGYEGWVCPSCRHELKKRGK